VAVSNNSEKVYYGSPTLLTLQRRLRVVRKKSISCVAMFSTWTGFECWEIFRKKCFVCTFFVVALPTEEEKLRLLGTSMVKFELPTIQVVFIERLLPADNKNAFFHCQSDFPFFEKCFLFFLVSGRNIWKQQIEYTETNRGLNHLQP
jgi:hypothetical protein